MRRRFSRSEWAIRRLHLSTSEETSPDPGLLMIQIDGLSRAQFEKAVENGRLPFLRRLMRREHYEVRTFYSGLPSSTPAVQGELFYGKCCAVPAFSFLNRASRQIATMFQPDWAKEIEAGLAAKSEGLLKGGSSWSNIYTGGATQNESHFCAASIGWGDLRKSASFFGFLSILILQLPAIIRLVALSFAEVFVALYDVFQGIKKGEKWKQEFKFIVARVFVCIALREFITIGAKIDLARGLPIVHLNFLGYDEQSHRRGPASAFAHWSLKGIDVAIENLYRAAQRSGRRDYRVWIYSDHGQESARSFPEHFEGGVEDAVRRGLAHVNRVVAERSSRPQVAESPALWSGTRRTRRSLEKQADSQNLTREEEESFSVTAMGPVGHIYFAKHLADLDKRELAKWLVHHGKIPGVLFQTSKGKVEWIMAAGTVNLPEDGPRVFPHPEEIRKQLAADLVTMTENENAGDLVILGWSPDGPPWTFAMERGAHAGPGLIETQGFALLPVKTRLPAGVREFIRPSALREAALHLLGRDLMPSRERSASSEPSLKLRVMTYNVHSCFGMDGKISPSRIARVIEMHDPDIVALQEIDLGRVRSRGHDQARMIADELGFHFSFCPTVVRGKELYGHALLTRFPVEVVKTGLLNGGPNPRSKEPRGAIWAKVELNGIGLHIVNTHFGLGRQERVLQAADLLGDNWIGKISPDDCLILCGDFNSFPDSLPYQAISSRFRDAQMLMKNFRPQKTFAALYPFTRIDHIFVSPQFEVEKIQVPKNNLTRIASDHLPLIADLSVKTNTKAKPHAMKHSHSASGIGRG